MSSSVNRVIQLKDRLPVDVSGQITDSLSRIADQLTDAAQRWSSKATSAARSTDAYVRTSPWQALGVMAFVGFAAGLLASRRVRQARLRRKAALNHHALSGG